MTRIIDFCEWHREGVTRLLDLGGLSFGFWVIRKWIAVNVVNEWERSVQGPSLDHGFCVFCETFEKHVGWFTSIPSPGADYIELFLKCDVRLRMRENVGSDLFESTAGWKEVLRAPAAHGVSSIWLFIRAISPPQAIFYIYILLKNIFRNGCFRYLFNAFSVCFVLVSCINIPKSVSLIQKKGFFLAFFSKSSGGRVSLET